MADASHNDPASPERQQLIASKQALLTLAEGLDRVRILIELGDLHSGADDGFQEAIRHYEEALRTRPGDLPLLHKLRAMYARAGRWDDVVALLRRAAGAEGDAQVRGKLHETAAVILQGTLQRPGEAVAEYEAALDAFFADPARVTKERLPELLAPLSAIDQIGAARGDWDGLARSYLRMLERMPKEGHSRAKLQLTHALGEIHRTRRGDVPQAIAAYEAAQRIEPDNAARRRVLEGLYAQAGGAYAERAEEAARRALVADPQDAEAYRTLRRALLRPSPDGAWLCAAALVALGRADEEEARAYEEGRARGAVAFRGRLTDERWLQLWHEGEDRVLSSLLGAVGPAVGLLRGAEHRQLGLSRAARRELATDETLLGRTIHAACPALSVQPPEVYFLPDREAGLLLGNARVGAELVPCLVAGAQVLSGLGPRELAYLVGAFLCKLRPEHYLRLVVETAAEREVALRAALLVAGLQLPIPPALKDSVEGYAQALRPHLRPAALEHLQQVALRAGAQRLAFDLQRWTAAVDLSAARAGLLLCGDPVVAARLAAQEPGGAQRERVGDLLRFAVSPQHLTLRQG